MDWIINAIIEKNSWKDNLFYGLLLLLIIAIPTSVALTSLTVGLLAINLVLTFNLKQKIKNIKGQKNILYLTSIFLIFLLFLPFTNDWGYAVYELRKMVFWLAIPLSIGAYKPLSRNRYHLLILVLVLTTLVASIASVYKLQAMVDSAVGNFRAVTWITHIRFSLILVFCISAVINWIVTKNQRFAGLGYKIALLILVLFFIYTLLVLKSFIGYIVLMGMFVFSILYWTYTGKIKYSIISYSLVAGFILIPVTIIGFSVNRFYQIEEYDSKTIDRYTDKGNKYTHDFEGKMVENGQYVYLFISREELEEEWEKVRPDIPFYGKDASGNNIEYTLYRYMTSKGLRKDANGFAKLSEDDLNNICKGIPNILYAKSQFAIYPRIYETIWEVDQYLKKPDPKDKSLAMRFELLKIGYQAWKKSPVLGVGTGNAPQAMKKAHYEGPFLGDYNGVVSSHNQYLNFLVKFGILGFLLIFYVVYLPLFKKRMRNNYLFLSLMVIFTIANLGDANFEDHSGIIIFVTFYTFLYVNTFSKNKINKKMK